MLLNLRFPFLLRMKKRSSFRLLEEPVPIKKEDYVDDAYLYELPFKDKVRSKYKQKLRDYGYELDESASYLNYENISFEDFCSFLWEIYKTTPMKDMQLSMYIDFTDLECRLTPIKSTFREDEYNEALAEYKKQKADYDKWEDENKEAIAELKLKQEARKQAAIKLEVDKEKAIKKLEDKQEEVINQILADLQKEHYSKNEPPI